MKALYPSTRRIFSKAFTLVELLVVVSIIAVLIAILLPTLNAAYAQVQLVQCASNLHQLGIAALMFKDDHQGRLQTVSDDVFAKAFDRNHIYFSYHSSNGLAYTNDWASALLPYLGSYNPNQETFYENPSGKSKVYTCPSDRWQDDPTPGYMLQTNVIANPNGSPYFPISYGVNADICCLTNQAGQGVFENDGNTMSVTNGPPSLYPGSYSPLCCNFGKVNHPYETLLFADCGTRPHNITAVYPLDCFDSTYYTTNYSGAYTLADTLNDSWLGGRIPIANPYNNYSGSRHRSGRINVCFCDGHVDNFSLAQLNQVYVTPYAP